MAFQIFVSLVTFGALANQVAEDGARKFPQFTWAASTERTVWPEHLSDDQWEAQQWLHDQLEAAVGAPVPAEVAEGGGEASGAPVEAARPEAPAGSAPVPPEAAALVGRVVALLEDAVTTLDEGIAALGAFATRERLGVAFEVKGDELARLYLARAEAAEAAAKTAEARAAAAPVLEPQPPVFGWPLPSAPEVAEGPKLRGAQRAEAQKALEAKVQEAQDAQRKAVQEWQDAQKAKADKARAALLAAEIGHLGAAAARDRWAAAHLVAERVYVIDAKEIGAFFHGAKAELGYVGTEL